MQSLIYPGASNKKILRNMKRSASFNVGGRNPIYCVILQMKTLRIYIFGVVYIMLSQQGGFYSEILWCDQYMKAAGTVWYAIQWFYDF